jgi:hypothetical protein
MFVKVIVTCPAVVVRDVESNISDPSGLAASARLWPVAALAAAGLVVAEVAVGVVVAGGEL